MDNGHFYFIIDNYFVDFPDNKLQRNKEVVNGIVHDRPCFYSFSDGLPQIYWMIPISSQVGKYKAEYYKKIAKHGKCYTINFGYVLGYEKAFLIQNMFPITPKYIKNEYIDPSANVPVRIDGAFEKVLLKNAKSVLSMARHGTNLIFPDVLSIEKELQRQIILAMSK